MTKNTLVNNKTSFNVDLIPRVRKVFQLDIIQLHENTYT